MTFPCLYRVVSMPFHWKTIIISSCCVISQPSERNFSAALSMSMSISSVDTAMRALPPQRRAVVNLTASPPVPPPPES